MALISAYAPHSGWAFDVRQRFSDELNQMYTRASVNGLRLIMGDLNTRTGVRLPGKEYIIGDFCFGTRSMALELGSNRSLFMELCESHALAACNTFFNEPGVCQATYRHIWALKQVEVTDKTHLQLDHVLCALGDLPEVEYVKSDCSEPLASHHFVVIAQLEAEVNRADTQSRSRRFDRNALRDAAVAQGFAERFTCHLVENSSGDTTSVNDFSSSITKAFVFAEETTLPEITSKRRKPWISDNTLQLIDERKHARAQGNTETEVFLHKSIRRSAKDDRRRWLMTLADSGAWADRRKLRKPVAHKEGRLANQKGELVSTEMRADTFTQYLQDVQWAVRHVTGMTEQPLYDELNVSSAPITLKELPQAAKRFKAGKAVGRDGVPMEYWKTILNSSSKGADWLLAFCNAIWSGRQVPDSHEHPKKVTLNDFSTTFMPSMSSSWVDFLFFA